MFDYREWCVKKLFSDLACSACPYGVMFVKMSKGYGSKIIT